MVKVSVTKKRTSVPSLYAEGELHPGELRTVTVYTLDRYVGGVSFVLVLAKGAESIIAAGCFSWTVLHTDGTLEKLWV